METLQNLLDSSTVPALTALLLGLLTAISPCPLATNIAAMGYLAREVDNRRRIFVNGLLYTAGRILAYTLLGAACIALLRSGGSTFAVQRFIGGWTELLIGALLLLTGLFMLFGDRLRLPGFGFTRGGERLKGRGGTGALLLGALFALAFCPTSGVLYFGCSSRWLQPRRAATCFRHSSPWRRAFPSWQPPGCWLSGPQASGASTTGCRASENG